ncbi:MAG: hypothetical protein IJP16_01760 [Clostridia bacterium]|nr:hypothetical protein [Clostridia bacterium]
MKKPLIIALVPVTALILFLLFEMKLFPIIERLAIAEGRSFATVTVNGAIYDVLQENESGGLVTLERGSGGEIVSLSADTERINLIKSLVSREVQARLSDGKSELSIPLGSLTGIKLLSGRGPNICVKALPVRSVTTDIGAVFLEAGINQTWHRVVLNVTLELDMLVLSHAIDCHVSDTVVLTDTVIVGRVPDAYTDINKIEDELLGDVVDFSASSN